MSPLVLFDNHLGDANSKIKEEYVKMAHNLSFGTGRRRDVDNGGEHSPTWNVRTLFQNGKFDNVKQEMTRMRINILGMCEVRWTGAGLHLVR